MNRSRRALLLTLIAALASCGPRNPLIGRWVMDENQSLPPAGQLVIGALRASMGEIEFTETSMIARGAARAVRYEIAGSRVTVYGPDGRGMVVDIEGERVTIAIPNPLGGEFRLRFRRA